MILYLKELHKQLLKVRFPGPNRKNDRFGGISQILGIMLQECTVILQQCEENQDLSEKYVKSFVNRHFQRTALKCILWYMLSPKMHFTGENMI